MIGNNISKSSPFTERVEALHLLFDVNLFLRLVKVKLVHPFWSCRKDSKSFSLISQAEICTVLKHGHFDSATLQNSSNPYSLQSKSLRTFKFLRTPCLARIANPVFTVIPISSMFWSLLHFALIPSLCMDSKFTWQFTISIHIHDLKIVQNWYYVLIDLRLFWVKILRISPLTNLYPLARILSLLKSKSLRSRSACVDNGFTFWSISSICLDLSNINRRTWLVHKFYFEAFIHRIIDFLQNLFLFAIKTINLVK